MLERGIVLKLGKSQVFMPRGFTLFHQTTQNHLDLAMCAFGLSIRLRVERGAKFELSTECVPQRLPKGTGKSTVAITHDAARYPKFSDNVREEDIGHCLCTNVAEDGDEASHL